MKITITLLLLVASITTAAHTSKDDCRSGFARGYAAGATKQYQQQLIAIDRERLAMERERLALDKQRATVTCYFDGDTLLSCNGKPCVRDGDQLTCQ